MDLISWWCSAGLRGISCIIPPFRGDEEEVMWASFSIASLNLQQWPYWSVFSPWLAHKSPPVAWNTSIIQGCFSICRSECSPKKGSGRSRPRTKPGWSCLSKITTLGAAVSLILLLTHHILLPWKGMEEREPVLQTQDRKQYLGHLWWQLFWTSRRNHRGKSEL